MSPGAEAERPRPPSTGSEPSDADLTEPLYLTTGSDEVGQRLDAFLASKLTRFSRVALRRVMGQPRTQTVFSAQLRI